MDFDRQKKDILGKIDKSKKNSIDTNIESLINLINSKSNYYTSSSCSGRIMLIEKPDDKKQNCRWMYVTHELADINEVLSATKKPFKGKLWFKFESVILHVSCNSLQNADNLLILIKGLGLKRSGIISLHKKIVIEIIGTENVESLIGAESNLLVDETYLRAAIIDANEKMALNFGKIAKLSS